MSHEFCVFDLNWSFLFFIPRYHVKCAITAPQRWSMEYTSHDSWIVIDISHDRFLNGKHGWREDASSVKKKVLFRRIIQKEVLFKSSYVKYKSTIFGFVFVLWIFKIKHAFLASTRGKI